jgi:hypothetical protein
MKASKTAPTFPDPDIIAQEIVEDLQAALAQFSAVTDAWQRAGVPIASDLKKEQTQSLR